MEYTQAHAEHFFCFQQVADISSAVMAACRALAAFLDRAWVQFVFLIEQVQLSCVGVDVSMAAVSARVDAVKEVDAAFYAFQDVCRGSDAHQVGRFVFRQIRHYFFQNMIHFLMALPDGKASDGIAVQIHLTDSLRMVDPDVRIDGALIDTKQHLVRVDRIFLLIQLLHFLFAPHQPPGGTVHGILYILPVRNAGRTFIKRHRDGRCKIGLDLHTFFRSHKNLASVHMRIEINALFFDLSQTSQ